jgi:hypothetical protein
MEREKTIVLPKIDDMVDNRFTSLLKRRLALGAVTLATLASLSTPSITWAQSAEVTRSSGTIEHIDNFCTPQVEELTLAGRLISILTGSVSIFQTHLSGGGYTSNQVFVSENFRQSLVSQGGDSNFAITESGFTCTP